MQWPSNDNMCEIEIYRKILARNLGNMLFLTFLSLHVPDTVENDRDLKSFRFHFASETLYNNKDFGLLVNAGRDLDEVFLMKNLSSQVI